MSLEMSEHGSGSIIFGLTGLPGSGKTVIAKHLSSLSLEKLVPDSFHFFNGIQVVPMRQLLAWNAISQEQPVHSQMEDMQQYHTNERAAGNGKQIIGRLGIIQRHVIIVDSFRHPDDIGYLKPSPDNNRSLANGGYGYTIVKLACTEKTAHDRFYNNVNDHKYESRAETPQREAEWRVAMREKQAIRSCMKLASLSIDASGNLSETISNASDVLSAVIREAIDNFDRIPELTATI